MDAVVVIMSIVILIFALEARGKRGWRGLLTFRWIVVWVVWLICIQVALFPQNAELNHQIYLDEKREFNDKVYGTPEMRREDAARKIAEDLYTHEK